MRRLPRYGSASPFTRLVFALGTLFVVLFAALYPLVDDAAAGGDRALSPGWLLALGLTAGYAAVIGLLATGPAARGHSAQRRTPTHGDPFRRLVEAAPLPISLRDAKGRILYRNPAHREAFPSSEDPPPAPLDAEEERALRTDRAVISEKSLTDGHRRKAQLLYRYPLAADGDRPASLVTIHADVDHYQRQAEALRLSQARLALAQHLAHLGHWEQDAADGGMVCSDEVYHILDRKPGLFEAPEAVFFAAVHPDDRAALRERLRTAAEGSRPVGLEFRILRPDHDRRVVYLRAQPFRDENGRPQRLSGTLQDVTEQTRAREEAEEKRIALECLAEARRQKDSLVREVHHRIKNYLQGFVALLEDQGQEHPEAASVVATIVGQVDAMTAVHGLQSRNSGDSIDFFHMVSAIVDSASAAPRPSNGVRLLPVQGHSSNDLGQHPHLQVDEAIPLSLVVNELLHNAAKHSRPGQATVRPQLARDGTRAVLRITNPGGPLPAGFDLDTGVGLGTGLGLVHALMPRQGAHLSLTDDGNRVITELACAPPLIHWQDPSDAPSDHPADRG